MEESIVENKSQEKKWLATDPVPPVPAFGRMVYRYRGREKINDVLDTIAKENPYSEDRGGNSSRKYYTMIPIISSDPTDLP